MSAFFKVMQHTAPDTVPVLVPVAYLRGYVEMFGDYRQRIKTTKSGLRLQGFDDPVGNRFSEHKRQ